MLVFSSRGSGDTGSTTALLGAPGKALYDTIHKFIPQAEPWGNPYKAVGVASFWHPSQIVNGLGAVTKLSGPGLGAYHDSAVNGEKLLAEKIHDTVADCGKRTWLVLTGYSQGAQVTADVYQRNLTQAELARIAGVVLFGDPYFNSRDGAVDAGPFSNSRNGILGTRPALTPTLDRRVFSFCHAHDPICQGVLTRSAGHITADPIAVTGKQHDNYPNQGEPARAGGQLAALIAWHGYPTYPVFDPAALCAGGPVVSDTTHRDRNNGLSDGDLYWALGQGRNHVLDRQEAAGSYCSANDYHGTFVSVAGSSPGRHVTIPAGIKGQFQLFWVFHFDGQLSTDPAVLFGDHPQLIDWQCIISNGKRVSCDGPNPEPVILTEGAETAVPQHDYRYRSDRGDYLWVSPRGRAGDITR